MAFSYKLELEDFEDQFDHFAEQESQFESAKEKIMPIGRAMRTIIYKIKKGTHVSLYQD